MQCVVVAQAVWFDEEVAVGNNYYAYTISVSRIQIFL